MNVVIKNDGQQPQKPNPDSTWSTSYLEDFQVLPAQNIAACSLSPSKNIVLVSLINDEPGLEDLKVPGSTVVKTRLTASLLGYLGERPVIGVMNRLHNSEPSRWTFLNDRSGYLILGDGNIAKYHDGELTFHNLRNLYPNLITEGVNLATDGEFLYLYSDVGSAIRPFKSSFRNEDREEIICASSEKVLTSTSSTLYVVYRDDHDETLRLQILRHGKLVSERIIPDNLSSKAESHIKKFLTISKSMNQNEINELFADLYNSIHNDAEILAGDNEELFLVDKSGLIFRLFENKFSIEISKSIYNTASENFFFHVNNYDRGIFALVRDGNLQIWKNSKLVTTISGPKPIEEVFLQDGIITGSLIDGTLFSGVIPTTK